MLTACGRRPSRRRRSNVRPTAVSSGLTSGPPIQIGSGIRYSTQGASSSTSPAPWSIVTGKVLMTANIGPIVGENPARPISPWAASGMPPMASAFSRIAGAMWCWTQVQRPSKAKVFSGSCAAAEIIAVMWVITPTMASDPRPKITAGTSGIGTAFSVTRISRPALS